MDIRYFFAKNRVEIGDITLTYMPTEAMLADLMTKPLVGELFCSLAADMVGYAKDNKLLNYSKTVIYARGVLKLMN